MLFITNIPSLDNQIDIMRLRVSSYKEIWNCCVLLLTETWLCNNAPDSVYHQRVLAPSDLTERKITICSNQEPWLNGEGWCLLKAQNLAFRTGYAPALRAARRELEVGIKRAKANYAPKYRVTFLPMGIKSINDYSKRDLVCPQDPIFPDALNTFYAYFETTNYSPCSAFTLHPGELSFSVSVEDVRRTVLRINT